MDGSKKAALSLFLSSPLQMLLVSAGDGQVAELGCPNVPGEQSAVHSQALREAAPSPDQNLPLTGPGAPDSNR